MYLEQFALIVEDHDKAIRFFVDALGFELVEDLLSLTSGARPRRSVVVRPPGATSALLLAQAEGVRQARVVGDQFAQRVGLFLRVDDLEAAYDRMRIMRGRVRHRACGTSPTLRSRCLGASLGMAGICSGQDRPAARSCFCDAAVHHVEVSKAVRAAFIVLAAVFGGVVAVIALVAAVNGRTLDPTDR